VDKQDFFAPLAKLLEKSVNFKDEEFTQLKGVLAFEALERVTRSIDAELAHLDQGLRPVMQLTVTRDLIMQILDKMRSINEDVKALNNMFQVIRNTLGDPNLVKHKKKEQLDSIYAALWKDNKVSAGYRSLDDLKSLQPKNSLSNDIILCQWKRLWKTHANGLFHYMDVDGMTRTNIPNEQIFGELRREVIKAHGASHEAYMILTRGIFQVKDITSMDAISVQEVLVRYDVKELKVMRQPLQERIDEQVSWFRNAPLVTDAVHIIAQNIQNKSWEAD
jgi:hypothetical protein